MVPVSDRLLVTLTKIKIFLPPFQDFMKVSVVRTPFLIEEVEISEKLSKGVSRFSC